MPGTGRPPGRGQGLGAKGRLMADRVSMQLKAKLCYRFYLVKGDFCGILIKIVRFGFV